MDRLHHEFFGALDTLTSTKEQDFSAAYGAFVRQVECAFREEEQWMEESDFPAFKSHQEQHARVLGALHNVHSRVMDGDIDSCREVVTLLLPQWFAFHMSTMDATLALAMQMAETEAMQPTRPAVHAEFVPASP